MTKENFIQKATAVFDIMTGVEPLSSSNDKSTVFTFKTTALLAMQGLRCKEFVALVNDKSVEVTTTRHPDNSVVIFLMLLHKPSVYDQFLMMKKKYPGALILFRLGDFYETYDEDAEAAADILGITLTRQTITRRKMAGFPHQALDAYLPKLIRAGKRVAISDEI